MLQRIQTIYLVLVSITLILTLFFPIATYPFEGKNLVLDIFGFDRNDEGATAWIPYYILIGLSVGLAVFSITQFKNRKRQLRLGYINYIVLMITIVLIFLNTDAIITKLHIAGSSVSYGVSMFLPVVALPLIFLANRAIKNDEKLVKSVDRLRD